MWFRIMNRVKYWKLSGLLLLKFIVSRGLLLFYTSLLAFVMPITIRLVHTLSIKYVCSALDVSLFEDKNVSNLGIIHLVCNRYIYSNATVGDISIRKLPWGCFGASLNLVDLDWIWRWKDEMDQCAQFYWKWIIGQVYWILECIVLYGWFMP